MLIIVKGVVTPLEGVTVNFKTPVYLDNSEVPAVFDSNGLRAVEALCTRQLGRIFHSEWKIKIKKMKRL
ncbi:MAG: hypothetical protein AAB388_02395 [Patescibacteria group bacterium]|mgnify:CR=1 FL=1